MLLVGLEMTLDLPPKTVHFSYATSFKSSSSNLTGERYLIEL